MSAVALDAAKHITSSGYGFVSSIDTKTGENFGHTLTKVLGSACTVKGSPVKFPVKEDGTYGALWGHALNIKESFFTNSPALHPCSTGLPGGHVPLNNYLAVPVQIGETLLGMIALANAQHDYSERDTASVERIAEIFALALHRQEYETQRGAMEQDLRQLQKNEAIGVLAGGIAHDFNNILAPILGYSEILQEDIPPNSPLQESVGHVLSAAERAKGLVGQILTFSRQQEQEIVPLKPGLVITEVLTLIKATLPATIEVSHHIDVKSRTIMADPTQLHQVVMNLLTNAYHAMQEEGGKLTVNFENIDISDPHNDLTLSIGPYVVLHVEDTGQGMDKSTKEKIFDPYFTTKPQGKATGLGLSVAYGIIKKYNGGIEVKSEAGSGTIIRVYLPAAPQKTREEISTKKSTGFNGDETILLVDDEEPILKVSKRKLERLGYRVTICNDSQKALALITSSSVKFDLIITDMTMPRMTGELLTKEIRKVYADLPVIICTGFSETMTPERAKLIGASGLLMKPVAGNDLAQMVREALDERGDSHLA